MKENNFSLYFKSHISILFRSQGTAVWRKTSFIKKDFIFTLCVEMYCTFSLHTFSVLYKAEDISSPVKMEVWASLWYCIDHWLSVILLCVGNIYHIICIACHLWIAYCGCHCFFRSLRMKLIHTLNSGKMRNCFQHTRWWKYWALMDSLVLINQLVSVNHRPCLLMFCGFLKHVTSVFKHN